MIDTDKNKLFGYNIGDVVEVFGSSSNFYPRKEVLAVGYINNFLSRLSILEIVTHTNIFGHKHLCNFESIKTIKHREVEMNQVIIDAFPITKEAVLVDKWFGQKLSDPMMVFLLKGKEADLLVEAQRLENESKKKDK